MKPVFSNTIEELQMQFQIIDHDPKVKSSLLFFAEETTFDHDDLNKLLRAVAKPTIGGIFPEVIFNSERKKSGILIIPLNFKLDTMCIDLKEDEEVFYSRIDALCSNQEINAKTIFVFVDAMADCKSNYIDYIFNYFGISVSYFGAGCGSLSFESTPCIICNNGLKSNALVIGLSNKQMALAESRSWEPVSAQLKICEAENNRVKVINWEPAISVYKKVIEKHAGKEIKDEDLPGLLKSYPLGLVKIDGDIVVRDPYKIENDEILFFDSIKKGEYVCVMHGDKESILQGAANAKKNLLDTCNSYHINHSEFMLCVNCISRVLYLQDDYKKEFSQLDDFRPVFGVLSIGEIVNPGISILEMFNKVLALAIWTQ